MEHGRCQSGRGLVGIIDASEVELMKSQRNSEYYWVYELLKLNITYKLNSEPSKRGLGYLAGFLLVKNV